MTVEEHRPAVAAAVELVAGGGTLPAPLAEAAMEELMDGAAPPVQVAALLAMMRVRGETPEEVAARIDVVARRWDERQQGARDDAGVWAGHFPADQA